MHVEPTSMRGGCRRRTRFRSEAADTQKIGEYIAIQKMREISDHDGGGIVKVEAYGKRQLTSAIRPQCRHVTP